MTHRALAWQDDPLGVSRAQRESYALVGKALQMTDGSTSTRLIENFHSLCQMIVWFSVRKNVFMHVGICRVVSPMLNGRGPSHTMVWDPFRGNTMFGKDTYFSYGKSMILACLALTNSVRPRHERQVDLFTNSMYFQ